MFILKSKITIYGSDTFVFTSVNECNIQKSWKNLTQKGSIKIAKKITWVGSNGLTSDKPLIKRGDKIKIELGYEPTLTTYFDGYITKVGIGTPLEIEFEDSMWKLKQQMITKYSVKKTTIKALLNDLIKDFEIVAVDSEIGKFSASNASVSQVLEYIEKNYGLISYFVNDVLYCGMAYYTGDTAYTSGDKIKFVSKSVYREVGNSIIENNLEYSYPSDEPISVKCISMNSDNTKTETTYGISGGATRTLHFFNKSASEMQKIAKNEVQRLQSDGITGTFTTFGDVQINFGDSVDIYDPQNENIKGSYFVEAVEYSFGVDGFRQNITLDSKSGI
jgi:hypothetical protein